MTPTSATMIDLPAHEPYAVLAQHVGDPGIDRLRRNSTVEFWFGAAAAERLADSTHNTLATTIVRRLLVASDVGDYAVSDRDRGRARAVLAGPGAPTVYGNCVITGLVNQRPTGLPESFMDWLASWADATLAATAEDLAVQVGSELDALFLDSGLPYRVAEFGLTW